MHQIKREFGRNTSDGGGEHVDSLSLYIMSSVSHAGAVE